MLDYKTVLAAEQRAYLQTLARDGLTRAADALSRLAGHPIQILLTTVDLVPVQAVPGFLGGPETVVSAVYLQITGQLEGYILLLFPLSNAMHVTDLMLGLPPGSTRTLGELEQSALGEAGNVTGSAFLNYLSEISGLDGRPSPPAVVIDMVGAVLDLMLIQASQYGDDILMLEAIFRGAEESITGYLWVVPMPGSLRAILETYLS